MAFEPVKLVHPKTGVAVTATTAIDLTTFRYDGGYVPVDVARRLVKVEDADKLYPKLAEGLKAVDDAEKAEEPEAPAEETTSAEGTKTPAKPRGGKSAAGEKSGTDASGNQVGVN